MGLPLWSVSSRATSSAFSSSRSASLLTRRPRSRADIFPHGPFSAARAAFTASSTSLVSAEATVAITSSVAGLMTSMVFPLEASRHSLLIRSLLWSIAAVAKSLSSLKRRFALLQICGYPLFGVIALEEELLKLPLDGQAFEEAGFGARLDGALHPADRAAGLV